MISRSRWVKWFLCTWLAAWGAAHVEAQESTFTLPPAGSFFAPVGPQAVEQSADPPLAVDAPAEDRSPRMVWGIAGVSGDVGQRMAPNGVLFRPIYTVDMSFNIWLWPAQGLYLFDDTIFYMGSTQKGLNFTKRELDFNFGLAWNYYGQLEARLWGYADSNLNRGASQSDPSGYSDGLGLENRFYLSPIYSALGTAAYDQAKATFVSVGYYPTKNFIGADGKQFKPSLFLRAYLTYDLAPETWYLFADLYFLTKQELSSKMFDANAGVAWRPCPKVPRLEFRGGCQNIWDTEVGNARPLGYVSMRYIF